MNDVDIRSLRIFDAIYLTGGVSRAAEMLNLGQPAVSIALSKLRKQFDDPLFARTSKGMEPTPFCRGLHQRVREALQALEAVSGHRDSFHPATADRTFRICMTDISQLVLLPKLWETISVSAPAVRIEVIGLSSGTTQMLETGDADLAMGYLPQLEAGFYQQLLFKQKFVCLVSAHHPRIKLKLTRKQYESENHAMIVSSGAAPIIVDKEIARQGIKRRITLKIPNFICSALMVENTDLVVTIPKRLADILNGRGQFRVFPVPFDLPDYSVKQHWHHRFHHDPGNVWLRRIIAQLVAS